MKLRFLASRAPFIGALLPFLLVTAPVPAGAGMSLAIVPPYIEKVVPSGSRITDTLSFTNTGDVSWSRAGLCRENLRESQT